MDKKKLNDRQETFCREYLIDLNATQAAVRAGYSPSTANRIASQNLSKPDIQDRIAELKQARNERNDIDADYVLQRLAGIDALDVADILDEAGALLSVRQWPKEWRVSVSSIEVQEQKEAGFVVGQLKKIKIPDKVKNIELIGKHVQIQAFKDNVNHSGEIGIVWNETKNYGAKSKTDTGS